MKKKIIISLLITVVSVGLILFAHNQVGADSVPTDTVRVFHCENGELGKFFFEGGVLIRGQYCSDPSETNPTECEVDWEEMDLVPTPFICNGDKSDCRAFEGAEFFVSCSPLNAGGAWRLFR